MRFFLVLATRHPQSSSETEDEGGCTCSQVSPISAPGGGELPYEEYTGVCHELGSHFQEKNPKRVCQFFTKIPERAIISVRNSR